MKFELEIEESDHIDWQIILAMKESLLNHFEDLSDYGKNTCLKSFYSLRDLIEDFENEWLIAQEKRTNNRFRMFIRGNDEKSGT